MATSKTIKPTNVTVQIPEFTDQPDQRVNSNVEDKTIDGVNALSDKIDQSIIGNSPTDIGTSGANLNSYTAIGYYACSRNDIAATLSNCPISTAFTLQVIRGINNTTVIQRLTKHNTPVTYERILYSNAWTSWSCLSDQIATSSQTISSFIIDRFGPMRVIKAQRGLISGVAGNGVIPSGDRPPTNISSTCEIVSTDQTTFIGIGVVAFGADGTISITLNGSSVNTSYRCAFTCTWRV